jgi:hypothetical protein
MRAVARRRSQRIDPFVRCRPEISKYPPMRHERVRDRSMHIDRDGAVALIS